MKKTITFSKEQLENNKGGGGLEIRFPGFEGDPESPEAGQVFIEYYHGKIRVHVWDGNSEPTTVELEAEDPTLVPCEDCRDKFPPDQIRPYKYEPSIKLCDSCHDNRMNEED